MSEDSGTTSVGLTLLYEGADAPIEPSKSAVSWAAILAGAATAVAASLILLAVGSGLGLASVSPWANFGASLTTFTVMTAVWLIVMQWIASGLGGYLTGRLRIRWAGTHPHEVFFRDTAHGFLTWSIATLIAVVFISSSALMTVKSTAVAVADAAPKAGEAALASAPGAYAYDVDTLYRSTRPEDASMERARAESATILASGGVSGRLPAQDRSYLVQLVAARTGIAPADAQGRVDAVVEHEQVLRVKAQGAADAARKAGMALSIFTALSMLIGAFIASVAAALGGQQRDQHP
jgi:hypothetical protein